MQTRHGSHIPSSACTAFRKSALRYDFEYPLIGYANTPQHNAFARLQEKLNSGEAKLEWRAPRGYLDSLLKALNIDKSSQALVFSRTSLEISYITEKTPRAIYFDDEAYVAWVQGAPALELMAVDSVMGPVFYRLPNREPAAVAKLNRETLRCLNSQASTAISSTWGTSSSARRRTSTTSSRCAKGTSTRCRACSTQARASRIEATSRRCWCSSIR